MQMFSHQIELTTPYSSVYKCFDLPFRMKEGDKFRHENDIWICTSAYWDIKNCEQACKAERQWN